MSSGATEPSSGWHVLIVDPEAEWYLERLQVAAPDTALRAASTFADADLDLSRVRALITMGIKPTGSQMSAAIVAEMPRLEWIQCLLAGHDHLTEALADRPEVVLTTASGIHAPQMAETVLLHMLMLARGVRQQVASQADHVWLQRPQPLLDGRVVGIVGLGASGQRIARVCAALGMTVYGASRSPGPFEGVSRVFGRAQIAELAATVDFLVLVLPADRDTEMIVDARVLGAMRPSAHVVNVARGSVIDEQALIDALRTGQIAGAALDVFTTEPLPLDSPLWELPNVVVTPHIGGYSDRIREQSLAVVEPNLRAFVEGRPQDLTNVVSRIAQVRG